MPAVMMRSRDLISPRSIGILTMPPSFLPRWRLPRDFVLSRMAPPMLTGAPPWKGSKLSRLACLRGAR
eukprot:9725758-Alexandrium_andersonii.AAC.1